ncbi:MAG: lipopolysaccharide biosynthesis protein, partial [Chamaesiphon sp.]|nr:lipopolysaccharide biosynthesis protein [Chamaesiphon sp.]
SNARAAQDKLKMTHVNMLGLIVNGVIEKNETEDHFSSAQDYFTDEHDPEAPWTDYMTQLGTTIANQSQTETKFGSSKTAITVLGKSVDSKK